MSALITIQKRADSGKATGQAVDLSITGMSCASCVGRVERSLKAVPDVQTAEVNLATERAHVVMAPGADASALVQAIKKAGYEASVVDKDAQDAEARAARQEEDRARLGRAVWWSVLLTLPLFIIEMGGHVFPGWHDMIHASLGQQNSWILQFLLATAVLFGPGRQFFLLGLPALVRGAPDMNSLVAMGAGAAYLYSTVATFFPNVLPAGTVNVYFEAAAVIATLILVGRYLEARAKGRSSEAIKRLLDLQPETARVKKGDGFVTVAISDIRAGDLVQIRPGDRIPADGIVIEGESYVDESMISGEPAPVHKTAETPVTGATVNQNGALLVQVTEVGSDTVLAQIIRLVEKAQAGKLPIQALVDRITAWFVPTVMAIAALTFLVWWIWGPDPALSFALVNAVAVLIIACPCAMGLATPTSIMVGTGRGAQLGVLFRKGDAFQTLSETKVVAVDKTGTLTLGRPELTDMLLAPGRTREEILPLLAAVESHSEHPSAQAIVRAALAEGHTILAAERFTALAGLGVTAKVDGRSIHVGSYRYMEAIGVRIDRYTDEAQRLADEGKSPLYAAVDGELAAMLAVADPIKPTTASAIQALHAMGMKIVMISGDNQRTAAAIARTLGIDDVLAEVMPDEKARKVEELQRSYGHVAFVGDGINDAPALAQADVGIAIGTGTDVAVEAAEVVLMSGDMQGVPKAIGLSRATLKNIRQNLFWAFGYNAALIPVAAGALYPVNGALLSPMFAAGAMALSSVFVLGNALRLRHFGSREMEKPSQLAATG